MARSDLHVAIVYNFSPSPRLDVLRNLDAPLLEVASRAVTKLADWTACVFGAEAFALAASTHDTAATAQQHALTLAFTIASAPQTGARNTTRLLRLDSPPVKECLRQPVLVDKLSVMFENMLNVAAQP